MSKLWLTALLVVLFSCNSKNSFDVDVSNVTEKKVHIKRYEKIMFAIPPDSFIQKVAQLGDEFPVFLDGDLTDTNALLALKSFFLDPNMIELNELVKKKYKDLSELESEFEVSFRYFRHYFPELPNPEVFSYVSGLDFKYPVKFIGGSLLVGLDMYLGENTKAYEVSGFPQYRNKWSIQETVVPDAVSEIALGLMKPPDVNANLLEQIVYQGKRLFFVKSMMPEIADSMLFKYSKAQVDWAQNHQGDVWAYLIENQFLYSTDKKLIRKFTDEGPFTDLFSKKSPARLSYYIGFQIVSAAMAESDYTLAELLKEEDAQKILKISHYKPKL